MIIHISGAPGSGKTTLGQWIKKNYKNIVVYDLDDLYHKVIKKIENLSQEIFKKYLRNEFQKYVDKLIKNNKNICFVGLNYPDPRISYKGREIFVKPFKVEINANHKFYIDIPIKQIVKQKFMRTLSETLEDTDHILDDIIMSKKKVFELHIGEWISDSMEWKIMFQEEGYLLLNHDKIKSKIENLL